MSPTTTKPIEKLDEDSEQADKAPEVDTAPIAQPPFREPGEPIAETIARGDNPFKVIYDDGEGDFLHGFTLQSKGAVLKSPEGLCFVPDAVIIGAGGKFHVQ